MQFIDVARKRGLRNRKSPARKHLAQLLLSRQGPFMRELDDELLSGQFRHNE
jgi:hypothetical protein